MKPDVLIIGDSHASALNDGCKAIGMTTKLVIFAGRNWASGAITSHKTHGIWMKRPWAKKMFTALKEALDVDNLAHTDVPVLFSVGYHLGRMVPPFGWNNHIAVHDGVNVPDDCLAVSSGFLEEYVLAYRKPHFALIEQFAKATNLTVVAPPPMFHRKNYDAFRCEISRQIVKRNAIVYDPIEDLVGKTGILPEYLLESDRTHGNAEYGTRVIKELIRRGYLPERGSHTAA